MPTPLPARNIFDGTALPTTSTMKTSMGALRDFLAALLGATGTAADARAALGAAASGANADITSLSAITSINGGQLAGLRNRIINGNMNISQRGTSFPAPETTSYSLDRWQTTTTGTGVYTVSQQADVPSSNEFQQSIRITVTTADASIAAGDSYEVKQQIEGYNIRDLIGKPFTLSFWARSSKTGIHCCSFRNKALLVDRSYVSEYVINAANTWEYKSVVVSSGLITAGTWDWTNGSGLQVSFSLAAGSTYKTTTGSWQAGNYLATANQVNCLDTIGNIFAITGVQLEVGPTATTFEQRPYGMELALCQRYYSAGTGNPVFNGSAATVNISSSVVFQTSMRANPSCTWAGMTIQFTHAGGMTAYSATGAGSWNAGSGAYTAASEL